MSTASLRDFPYKAASPYCAEASQQPINGAQNATHSHDARSGKTAKRRQTRAEAIVSAMTQADGEDLALVQGIAVYSKKLQDRKKRIEDRIEIRPALMANALDLAELPRLETPVGTVTRKALPPKAIVLEEADIPARFYVPQEPRLDRVALLNALKERAAAIAEIKAEPGSPEYKGQLATIDVKYPAVPGAALSNGGATIQIRK